MNAEKFVKQEAKKKLNGSWVRAVAGLLTALLVPLIAVLIMEIAFSFLNVSDGTGFTDYMVFFLLFMAIAVAEIILFLPIVNGLIRMYCSLADKGTADVNDIFYFFETKRRYFAALRLSLTVFFRCVVAAIVCMVPASVCAAVSEYIYQKSFARSDDLTLVRTLDVCTVILIILGIAALVVFALRYLFSLSLFSYYGYSPEQSLNAGAAAAKRGNKSLVRLTASFIPWILLLFFVVPFLYVLPYMLCAYAVSVKYLLQSLGFKLVGGADCTAVPVQSTQPVANAVPTSGADTSPAESTVSPDAANKADETDSGEVFSEEKQTDGSVKTTESVTFTSPIEEKGEATEENTEAANSTASSEDTGKGAAEETTEETTEEIAEEAAEESKDNPNNGKAHE